MYHKVRNLNQFKETLGQLSVGDIIEVSKDTITKYQNSTKTSKVENKVLSFKKSK